MSVAYLKTILNKSKNVVCLLGRAMAAEYGCDFYDDKYGDEIELKYGYSPEEIFSSVYFNNRPQSFYEFYREELLKKRGAPTECDYALRRMEEDGKLLGIVTRGILNVSKRAGCKNVIQLYGNVDDNVCPRCGRHYDASYVLEHTPVPLCQECGSVLHPGVTLRGEILDNKVMTQAADLVSRADTLLVVSCNLQSTLASLIKYFRGNRIALVNTKEHFSDHRADCVCIGNINDIMKEAYPVRG